MSLAIGLVGLDSSHAEDFIRHLNAEVRYPGVRVAALQGDDSLRVNELLRLDPALAECATLDRLIESVDAVIVGHRMGALHRAAAVACLEAGRPTFVDKPLANSRSDGEAVVRAAERSGTPLLSGSALRWQAETRRIKARLAGIEGDLELHAWGTWYPESEYGGPIFYAIHTIELAQELLGPEFRKVKLKGTAEPVISYRAGDSDVTLSFHPLGSSGKSDFGVEVNAKGAKFRQPIPLGDDYMLPVVDQIAAMLRTGVSPMTADELLAPLALMEEIEVLLAERS
jgi:predicted dehydrogenase